MNHAWPVVLKDRSEIGEITLRPLRVRDGRAWREVRARNVQWLAQWEATVPVHSRDRIPSFPDMVRRLRQEAREGRGMPFAVLLDGEFVGQLSVAGMGFGSYRGCYIGYWVDAEVAGRGIIPTAVALACDHLFGTVAMHRVELAIRPENQASRRVAEKLGFRLEGRRERYLHIDGDWRDHAIYVLTAEEVPEGVLNRWKSIRNNMT